MPSVGMVLNSHVQTQAGLAKARNYDSVLHRELFSDNIPPAVYHTLVEEVNKALPTLHRYFQLRARMLGIEQMHYYDIYPPLVSLDKEFDLETSKHALRSRRCRYWATTGWTCRKHAMDERWMHVYPQRGKRSGAYMNQGFAYDVHPYILLNHNDDYSSLSTFAHEWGHAMHTLYAKQEQPFETAGYSTFIAEIPSTSLELILQNYMTENSRIDRRTAVLPRPCAREHARHVLPPDDVCRVRAGVVRGCRTRRSAVRVTGSPRSTATSCAATTATMKALSSSMTCTRTNGCSCRTSTSTCTCTSTRHRRPPARRCMPRSLKTAKMASRTTRTCLRAGGSNYPYLLLADAGVDLTQPEPYRPWSRR